MTPEQESDTLASLGRASLSGLARAGNFLDVPASAVRDVAATVLGRPTNPLDQFRSMSQPDNRVSGRDLMTQMGFRPNKPTGISGWADDPLEGLLDVAGFATEVVLDPLTYLTFGASAGGKLLRAARKAGVADDAGTLFQGVGRREGLLRATLGDLIDRPTLHDPIAREGRTIAVEKALKAEGLNLADVRDQPIGALMGYHLPFTRPVSLVRRGGMLDKFGGVMGLDDVTGKIAYGMDRTADKLGKLPGVRHVRQKFDAAVGNRLNAAEQEIAALRFPGRRGARLMANMEGELLGQGMKGKIPKFGKEFARVSAEFEQAATQIHGQSMGPEMASDLMKVHGAFARHKYLVGDIKTPDDYFKDLRITTDALQEAEGAFLGQLDFQDQIFPFTQSVKVVQPDGREFWDQVKGLNSGHALWRAKKNWEGFSVEKASDAEFNLFEQAADAGMERMGDARPGSRYGTGDPLFPDDMRREAQQLRRDGFGDSADRLEQHANQIEQAEKVLGQPGKRVPGRMYDIGELYKEGETAFEFNQRIWDMVKRREINVHQLGDAKLIDEYEAAGKPLLYSAPGEEPFDQYGKVVAYHTFSEPLPKTLYHEPIKGYHGGHRLAPGTTELTLKKVGTGTGGAHEGHGIYVASRKEVSEHYRNLAGGSDLIRHFQQMLPDDALPDEVMEMVDAGEFSEHVAAFIRALKADDWLGYDYPSQAIDAVMRGKTANFDVSPAVYQTRDRIAALYEVEMRPREDQFMDWDKAIRDQPEHIQQAVSEDLDWMLTRPLADHAVKAIQDRSLTGRDFYRWLTGERAFARAGDTIPDAADTSRHLLSKGIRGNKYLDAGSRRKGEGSYNYVLFDEADVTIKRILEQHGRRGAIQFKEAETVIHAFRGAADFSTFVHETGHLFRNTLPESLQREAERIFGVEEGAEWSEAAEEAFAAAFERYFRDGISASKPLENIFKRMANWMKEVYRTVVGTPLERELSPELRKVFDEMLDDRPAWELFQAEAGPSILKGGGLGKIPGAAPHVSRTASSMSQTTAMGDIDVGAGYLVGDIVQLPSGARGRVSGMNQTHAEVTITNADTGELFREFLEHSTDEPPFKVVARAADDPTNQISFHADALQSRLYQTLVKHVAETEGMDVERAWLEIMGEDIVPSSQLLEAVRGQAKQFRAAYDARRDAIEKMGGLVGQVDNYSARFVHPDVVKKLTPRHLRRLIPTSAQFTQSRQRVLRDIPEFQINRMLTDPELRKAKSVDEAAELLREKYGEQLDPYLGNAYRPERPTKTLEDGTKVTLKDADFEVPIDNLSDVKRDLMEQFEVGMENARQKHAEDLVEWINKHKDAPLFTRDMPENALIYLKGAREVELSWKSIHETFFRHAGEGGEGRIPLEAAFRRIGGKGVDEKYVDVEKAMKFFDERFGVDPNTVTVPAEYADAAAAIVRVQNEQEWAGEVAQMIDAFHRIWKASVTVIFPGFLARNFVSGQFVNATTGMMHTPADLVEYLKSGMDAKRLRDRALKGELTDDDLELLQEIAWTDVIDPRTGFDDIERSVNADLDQVQQIVPRSPFGVRSAHRDVVANEVRKIQQELPEAAADRPLERAAQPQILQTAIGKQLARGRQAAPGPMQRPRTALKKMWGAYLTAIEVGSRANMLVEWYNRVPMFMYLKKKGYDTVSAAEHVIGRQFDYRNNLSQFERGVMRRVVPFYSFSRFSMPLTARTLLQQPGGALAQTIRASNEGKRDAVVPDWVAEQLAIPLSSDDAGNDRYITGLGLAHEDPLQFLGGGQIAGLEAISRVSPLFKWMYELPAGETTFQRSAFGGRQLATLDPPVGRLLSNLGITSDARTLGGYLGTKSTMFEYGVSASPFSRMISTANVALDERKSVLERTANILTGGRSTTVSPAQKERVLGERIDRKMLELGGRQFPIVHFAHIPPEERTEEMVNLQQASNLLDRMKRRRKSLLSP